MEFLVLGRVRVEAATVIEELGEGIGEHFEDADKEQGHNNPFPDFLPYVCLYNLAEAKSADEHNHGDCYRRPKHETLAKSSDVHI